MAEGESTDMPSPQPVEKEDEEEVTPGYVAPKQVDLKTIQDMDQDDESLVKYKQQLLGQTADVKDEGGNNVLVKKMIIAPVDHAEIVLDLTGDLKKFAPVVIKEGTAYQIKIVFRVQREIVSGLRYAYQVTRNKLKVDKGNLMVGSYGPKTDPHTFTTPVEDAPSGLIQRGSYNITSKFTDDDKNIYLEWQWVLQVKKDWD